MIARSHQPENPADSSSSLGEGGESTFDQHYFGQHETWKLSDVFRKMSTPVLSLFSCPQRRADSFADFAAQRAQETEMFWAKPQPMISLLSNSSASRYVS